MPPPLLLSSLTALAVLLTACTNADVPTPEEVAASEAEEQRFAACQRLSREIAGTLQEYVDEFAPAADTDEQLAPAVPDATGLAEAADTFRQRRTSLGCESREMQVLMERAMADVEGEGPLARAVAAQVRDSVLSTTGPAATVTVEPGDDLAAAVHGAGPGALVRLAAGEHELDEPLLTLREVSVTGAGSDTTTIVSDAEDAVLLHGATGPIALRGVTVTHRGEQSASVLVVASGGHVLDDVVLRGGVTDDASSTGWGLVLGGGGTELPEGAEQTAVDVVVDGNQAGGVAVVDRTPVLTDLVATGNGGCGLCYLGSGGGEVRGATLTGNTSGVSVAGEATPTLRELTVSENAEIGVLAEGDAAPRLVGSVVFDNGPVGVAATGTSAPLVRATEVRGHEQVQVLAEGESTPTYEQLELQGGTLGLLARGTAEVSAAGLAVTGAADASVAFGGSSTGSLTGGSCEGDGLDVVLLEETTAEVGETSCEVLDQRGAG